MDYEANHILNADETLSEASQHINDVYKVSFTNVRNASVTLYANKVWRDSGNTAATNNGIRRPDIYYRLWRISKTGTYETYLKGLTASTMPKASGTYDGVKVDLVLDAVRNWTSTNTWFWRCDFGSLPRYDSEGNEYQYFVQELFASSKNGYVQYYYNGDGDILTAAKNQPSISGLTPETIFSTASSKGEYSNGNGSPIVILQINADGTCSSGTFINKLESAVDISGKKIWTNIRGTDKAVLPDVTIQLHRGLSTAFTPDSTNAVDGKTAIIDPNTTETYSFADMAKYDEYGRLYTYKVSEATALSGYASTLGSDFTTITNTFNKDNSADLVKLTFKKIWKDEKGNAYTSSQQVPALEMQISYQMQDENHKLIGTAANVLVTLDAVTVSAGGEYEYSYTSPTGTDALTYYAPNGQPYVYTAAEAKANGYALDTTKLTFAVSGDPETVDGIPVYTLKPNVDTPLSNVYDGASADKVTASITKNWPNSQYRSTAPANTDAVFALYRTTGTIDWAAPGTPLDTSNVAVTNTTGRGWNGNTFTFGYNDGIQWEKYDKAGNLYKYYVKEISAPADYKTTDPVQLTLSGKNMGGTINNSLNTVSLNITKNFVFENDSLENITLTDSQITELQSLGALPTSIRFKVQYWDTSATPNGWKDYQYQDGNDIKTLYWTLEWNRLYNGKTVLLTQNLPEYVAGTNTIMQYRAVETKAFYASNTGGYDAESDSTYTSGTIGNFAFGAVYGSLYSATNKTKTDTFTNTMILRKITVEKNWIDDSDRDGYRPGNLNVVLTRKNVLTTNANLTQTLTIQLSGTNQDTWSHDLYVPVFADDYANSSIVADDADKMSRYSVTETPIPANYTEKNSGTAEVKGTDDKLPATNGINSNWFAVTNTLTASRKEIPVSAEKKWADGENVYGQRPADVTLSLEYSLDGTNWKSGNDRVSADITDSADFTWDKTIHGTAQNKEDTWAEKAVWSNLYEYATGSKYTQDPIQYRVVETLPGGYASVAYSPETVSASGSNTQIEVTNTMNLVSLKVNKTWDDLANEYATRPASISFTVQSSTDGTNWQAFPNESNPFIISLSADNVSPADSNVWTKTVSNLPEKDGNGNAYQYRAVEGTVSVQYSHDAAKDATSKNGSVFTSAVTNSLITTDLSVEKIWNDQNNIAGSRPVSVEVKLQRRTDSTGTWEDAYEKDGTTLKTLTLSADNNWSGKFTSLLALDAGGNHYEYQAVEAVPDGYKADTVNSVSPMKSVITNTLQTITVSGTKTWNDYADKYKTRPQDGKLPVTVSVYENSAWQKLDPQPSVVWSVKDDNTWTFQINGLPKYLSDGQTLAEYQVTEDASRLPYTVKTGTGTSNGSEPVSLENDLDKTKLTEVFTVRITKHGDTANGPTLANTHYILAHVRDTDGKTEYYTGATEIAAMVTKGIAGNGLINALMTVQQSVRYQATWSENRADAKDLVTGADGTVAVEGLPVGTYYFQEVTPPSGYNIDQTPIWFILTSVMNDNNEVEVLQSDSSIPTPGVPDKPAGRTCQDDGYPAGYYWNAARQACVIDDVGGYKVPDTGDRN